MTKTEDHDFGFLSQLGDLSGFWESLRTGGLEEAKTFAKGQGNFGRKLLNAIGLFEGKQYKKGSENPMHCLAERIARSVRQFEEDRALERIVTFLIEG